jgi:cellobiose transport system permease protein
VKKARFQSAIRKWPYIFVAPFFLCYIAFFIFPISLSAYTSLFDSNIGEKESPFIGLENYKELFNNDLFIGAIKNSAIIVLITLPLLIIIGLFLAELLYNQRERRFFQTALFLPNIVPSLVAALMFSLLFDQKIGVVNAILVKIGLMDKGINWMMAPASMQYGMLISLLLWQSSGYYMLMYLAGMTNIPTEVYEAAIVDGAGRMSRFFRITLPMLKNTTIFLAITTLISLTQLFDQPYQLVRGLAEGGAPSVEKPLTTVMVFFFNYCFKQGRMGFGAAITYFLFLVILIVVFGGQILLRRRGTDRED